MARKEALTMSQRNLEELVVTTDPGINLLQQFGGDV